MPSRILPPAEFRRGSCLTRPWKNSPAQHREFSRSGNQRCTATIFPNRSSNSRVFGAVVIHPLSRMDLIASSSASSMSGWANGMNSDRDFGTDVSALTPVRDSKKSTLWSMIVESLRAVNLHYISSDFCDARNTSLPLSEITSVLLGTPTSLFAVLRL